MLHPKQKNLLFVLTIFITTSTLIAQTEVSGFYPKSKELTLATSYTFKNYDRFYRGTTLTDGNPAGLAGIESYILGIYGEYGITDYLSASLSIPYINVQSDNGQPDPVLNEASVSGVQDLTFYTKLKIAETKSKDTGKFTIGAAAGINIPIGDYEGAGVLSLGTNANSLNGDLITQYKTISNIFVSAQAGYRYKWSSDFDVPSALVYGFKLGYTHEFFYVDSQLVYQDSMDGLDIGTEEFAAAGGPNILPETEVDFLNINVNLYVPILKNIGVSATVGKNLDGRNFNKESAYSVGLVYKSI